MSAEWCLQGSSCVTPLPWKRKDRGVGSQLAVLSASSGLFGQREDRLPLGTRILCFWGNQNAIHSSCVVVTGHWPSRWENLGTLDIGYITGEPSGPQPMSLRDLSPDLGGLACLILGLRRYQGLRTEGEKSTSQLDRAWPYCSCPRRKLQTFLWFLLPEPTLLLLICRHQSNFPGAKKKKGENKS